MQEPDLATRIARGIDRVILWMAAVPLVMMMIHISFDVFSNLVWNYPVPLTNAVVTQYYMIAVAYLPLAATEFRRSHISVDLIVNMMAPRPRLVLDVLAQMFSMAIFLALALQSLQLAMEKLDRNAFLMEQTSRVTTWPSYFIIPLGFGVVVVLLAVRLYCQLLGRGSPEAEVGPLVKENDV